MEVIFISILIVLMFLFLYGSYVSYNKIMSADDIKTEDVTSFLFMVVIECFLIFSLVKTLVVY